MEMRAFVSAKQAYDAAENKRDVPRTPMVQLVKSIEFEHARQVLEERKRRSHG